jgi:hypothetical protein
MKRIVALASEVVRHGFGFMLSFLLKRGCGAALRIRWHGQLGETDLVTTNLLKNLGGKIFFAR